MFFQTCMHCIYPAVFYNILNVVSKTVLYGKHCMAIKNNDTFLKICTEENQSYSLD